MTMRIPLRAPMLLLGLLLSGCGGNPDVDVTIIAEDRARLQPIGTQLRFADAALRASVTQGLVALDSEGRVVPALAARWIVTEDGLSYIFRLRDMVWNDGSEVTADQVARLMRARFAELQSSRLGDEIGDIAESKSMTGRVIEIRLRRPRPNFLQYLAQPEFALFNGTQGAGPMLRPLAAASKGSAPDGTIALTLSERIQSSDAVVKADDVPALFVRSDTAERAIARFALGHSRVVLGGQFQHLPLVEAAEIDGGSLQFDPVAGLFGLRFRKAGGFWSEAANRRLLSMSIDRPAMLTAFRLLAWQEREKIVPEALDIEGITALPDWASDSVNSRQVEARQAVAAWRSSNGAIAPLALWLPDGPGSAIIFAHLRSDLRSVGLDARRVRDRADADAELIDMIAPYDSARWFLAQLRCEVTPVCNLEADLLIDAGDLATSLGAQARAYSQAEVKLVNHYSFIPLAPPVRWSLAAPGTPGFAVNPRGWHPLHPLIGIPIY